MSELLRELAVHCRIGDTTPFGFGPREMDCCIWAADWVLKRTGIDPAADWRGRYGSRREYMRMLLARGGLVRVAAQGLADVGAQLIEPAEAAPGDVGVIQTTDGPAMAIRCQRAWKAKTGDQLMNADAATYAWRLP